MPLTYDEALSAAISGGPAAEFSPGALDEVDRAVAGTPARMPRDELLQYAHAASLVRMSYRPHGGSSVKVSDVQAGLRLFAQRHPV